VWRETVEIAIRPAAIREIVSPDFDPNVAAETASDGCIIILSIAARLKRVGMETKLLIEGAGGGSRREPDRSMLRLLVQANRYREMVFAAQGRTMSDLAREAGVGRPYFCRVMKLGFLAPDVVKAVLTNRHPPELTAKRLSLRIRLPIAWEDQVSVLEIT